MYNLFFKILISIIILSTLGILTLKPKMHSRVLIYDKEYYIPQSTVQNDEDVIIPEKEQVQEVKNTVSNEVKQEVVQVNQTPQEIKTTKDIQKNPKEEVKIVTSQNNIKQPQKETVKVIQQPKKVETTKQPQKVETIKQPQKIETSKNNVESIKPIVVQQNKPIQQVHKQAEPKIMTEKEEEIAWNIWRSNLQNQIMKDTKLPYIPKGTVFKFSFDVDKYGRISNIKTWSLSANYTPYAIQYIAPVIRSYQGKDILDFPRGTQRLSTKFEGGWKISDSAKYSTPNDYNDVEKVKY